VIISKRNEENNEKEKKGILPYYLLYTTGK
jgi:hypothetical protein